MGSGSQANLSKSNGMFCVPLFQFTYFHPAQWQTFVSGAGNYKQQTCATFDNIGPKRKRKMKFVCASASLSLLVGELLKHGNEILRKRCLISLFENAPPMSVNLPRLAKWVLIDCKTHPLYPETSHATQEKFFSQSL